ncbi:MAG: hypothetical protein KDD89_09865 [Anaerolineales bacterium]|nr:hypothetical protein [Anaerolineales bacterium]
MSLSSHTDDYFDFDTDLEDKWADYLTYEDKALQRGRARQAHRTGKHKEKHQAKKSREEVLETLADEVELLTGFAPTYLQNFDPKHHEYRWLMESLSGFYQDKVLADVLRIVKAGKEANVYTCTGTAVSNHPLMAAKLYRPRMLRHLRNDAVYKEGRFIRDQSGKEQRGGRVTRALQKKTRFGQDLDFMTWIGHEFEMQKMLFAAGADVPEPIAQRGNTILMGYVGDENQPAPTLIETSLAAGEAERLFERIMENVRLMLSLNYVHGDLSAYNILYWAGRITIIDFPQLADARVNNNAFTLLERDVQRVYDYFAPYGITADPVERTAKLWEAWMNGALE